MGLLPDRNILRFSYALCLNFYLPDYPSKQLKLTIFFQIGQRAAIGFSFTLFERTSSKATVLQLPGADPTVGIVRDPFIGKNVGTEIIKPRIW